jgi:major inositol transporter-like SP family MFS transporter
VCRRQLTPCSIDCAPAQPVYIAEISPPHARGRLVTWSEIGTNVGINVGFAAGAGLAALPDDITWRCMLGTGCILPAVMLCLVKWVMPGATAAAREPPHPQMVSY